MELLRENYCENWDCDSVKSRFFLHKFMILVNTFEIIYYLYVPTKTNTLTLTPIVLFTHGDWHLDLLSYMFTEPVIVSILPLKYPFSLQTFVAKEVTFLLILLAAE